MIIRRQLYPNNKLAIKKSHDSGIEMKPIFKKTMEPNATTPSNSIVRDVEDLLKPIQNPNHPNHDSDEANGAQLTQRTERNLWRNDEVMEMLYTMQQVKALEKLNDKTVKSENVFKDVEMIMNRNGFVKKSHVQIWTKWKFLKSTYMTSRRNGFVPRMVPPQVYETIHQMISGLNQSMADSCSSADGDASSASGMVISGVEGGVSETGVTNGEDEDSFGMAHPIFGFRLGMVKAEPEDTGYEAIEGNASEKDPLEEEILSSKSERNFIDEEKNIKSKVNSKPEPVQRILEVPYRGRGRPPKNPPTATSTPKAALSSTKSAQMPPLRVAPFAKAIHTASAISPNRPPPPLTMPPTPRIRIANLTNLKSSDPIKFAQPKLTPKPIQPQSSPSGQMLRITKEPSPQTRSSSTPSPSYPKMKQIPMRKTPYSLRPDRAIPDLEASLSPPPPALEKPTNKRMEEVSTTKHLTMQSHSNNMPTNINRKRRSEWGDPLPDKQAKYKKNVEAGRNTPIMNNTDNSEKYVKVMQNVILDLSFSLRKVQTEMMRDFFNKQNELLEREHRFQMQQDRMIMKAFQEQTQEIMHSVKQLIGSIKSYKTDGQNESAKNGKEAKVNKKILSQQIEEQQREVEEMEENQMNDEDEVNENDNDNDEENEEQEDQEIEQDAEEMYTDGEEQQEQMEDQEENDHEEMEDNAEDEAEAEPEPEEDDEQAHEDEEQSQQSADEQHENDLAAEEHNNNSNDLVDDQDHK